MSVDIPALEAASEFWEFWGYIATGAVLLGVVGEFVTELTNWICDARLRKLIEKLSVLVLIAGIAGEILCQVRANNFNSLIAGVLNDRATASELELAKLKQPRSISGEKSDAVSKTILPFAGTKYDVAVVPSVEPTFLVELVVALTVRGKWEFVSNERSPHFALRPYGNIGTIGSTSGVLITYVIGSGFDDAASALVKALQDAGIAAAPQAVPGFAVSRGAQMPPNIIHVNIGSKP